MDFHDSVSSISHLFTAAWAAFATLTLLRLTRGHGHGQMAVGVFGFSMVALFTASGLFHGVPHPTVDHFRFFQKIDKSAVFFLIAGSWTPLMAYYLRDGWRRLSLTAMWSFVAVGIAALWLAPDLRHEWLVAVYAAVALSGLIPLPLYAAAAHGQSPLKWVTAIVGPFVAGAVIEVAKWPVLIPQWVGPHELLHVAVSTGVLVHFGFVSKYVVSYLPLANTVPALATAPVAGPTVLEGTIDWAATHLSGVTARLSGMTQVTPDTAMMPGT